MNYFEFYIGDYARDTARLRLSEHGAFLKLMCCYYGEEKALPGDMRELYVICSAISDSDRASVRRVADEYFPLCDDGLRHNFRADEEIKKAQKRISQARVNGSKGGRKGNPAGNPSGNPSGNPGVPNPVNPGGTHQVTQPGEALHTPYTRPQQEQNISSADAEGSTVNGHDLLGDPAVPKGRKQNPPVPYQAIQELFHEILCPPMPMVRKLDDERRKHLRARWNDELCDLESWRDYFLDVKTSDWLMGRTLMRDGTPFRCTFDYLISARGYRKISEGNAHS